MIYLGFDTSNYTTSVACCGDVILNVRKILEVKNGEIVLDGTGYKFEKIRELCLIYEQYRNIEKELGIDLMTFFNFDDILVTSGKSLTNNQINEIIPYNTNDALVYDEGYLAGYNAEHYTVTLEEGWSYSKKKTEDIMKNQILRQYHYDVVREYKQSTVYSNIKFKYVLLPVWKSNYKYRNKNFYFIVNGSTGKVGGKMPVSFWKVLITILIIALIFGLIIFLASY